MNIIDRIINKKNPTLKERKILSIIMMIDRLHKELSDKEVEEIFNIIKKDWRKHYPIDKILEVKEFGGGESYKEILNRKEIIKWKLNHTSN